MFWILFVMGAIAAVIIALLVGGLATPAAHTATGSMLIAAPIDHVWKTIRNVDAYASWRPGLHYSQSSTGDDGPEWLETTSRRAVRFGITADEAPTRFAARILDEDSPFVGAWEWTLEPRGASTLVTITERGSVANPIVRFLGAHVYGYTRQIDAYLEALVQHAAK